MLTELVAAVVLSQSASLQDVSTLPNRFNVPTEIKLVLVLSPTSTRGWRTARQVRREVLEKMPGVPVQTFVVWTPVLSSDSREAAQKATAHLTGVFVQHYWDPTRSVAEGYGRRIRLPLRRQLAWDCVFLHRRATSWLAAPPMPTVWMHQLAYSWRAFNAEELRKELERLANER